MIGVAPNDSLQITLRFYQIQKRSSVISLAFCYVILLLDIILNFNHIGCERRRVTVQRAVVRFPPKRKWIIISEMRMLEAPGPMQYYVSIGIL